MVLAFYKPYNNLPPYQNYYLFGNLYMSKISILLILTGLKIGQIRQQIGQTAPNMHFLQPVCLIRLHPYHHRSDIVLA